MSANFCSTCGHSQALHHHPNVAAGRPCSLDECECLKFRAEGPTSEEQRAEIRRLSELVRRSVEAASK